MYIVHCTYVQQGPRVFARCEYLKDPPRVIKYAAFINIMVSLGFAARGITSLDTTFTLRAFLFHTFCTTLSGKNTNLIRGPTHLLVLQRRYLCLHVVLGWVGGSEGDLPLGRQRQRLRRVVAPIHREYAERCFENSCNRIRKEIKRHIGLCLVNLACRSYIALS